MTPMSLNLRDTLWLRAEARVQTIEGRRKNIDCVYVEKYFDDTVYNLVTPIRNSTTAGRHKKD